MTTIAWLIVVVLVAAVSFVFAVWWTKRHPNESQRYYNDFEKTRTDLEATVKQQTDKLSTVVDSLDQRITVVEKSANTVSGVATELSTILNDIKLGLVKLGATPTTTAPAAVVVDPVQK